MKKTILLTIAMILIYSFAYNLFEGKGHKYWSDKMDKCNDRERKQRDLCFKNASEVYDQCQEDPLQFQKCSIVNPEPKYKNSFYEWKYVDFGQSWER